MVLGLLLYVAGGSGSLYDAQFRSAPCVPPVPNARSMLSSGRALVLYGIHTMNAAVEPWLNAVDHVRPWHPHGWARLGAHCAHLGVLALLFTRSSMQGAWPAMCAACAGLPRCPSPPCPSFQTQPSRCVLGTAACSKIRCVSTDHASCKLWLRC